MIRAGISIRLAIEGISEQVENPRFKQMLVQIRKDVEAGKAFSEALARYPKSFSPLYVNMVKASELSGGFPRMLDRIAGYLNQQIETRSMIVGAMTYPAIIAVMALATTIFLLMFVLPRFMVLFAGKEAALPGSTKMLLAMSGFLVNYWYVPLLAAEPSAGELRCCFKRNGDGRASIGSSCRFHSCGKCSVPSTSAADCTRWANSSMRAFPSWKPSASPPRSAETSSIARCGGRFMRR